MTTNILRKYNIFVGNNPNLIFNLAGIAQLVEQWIEDPRVPSSNLGLGIYKLVKSVVSELNNKRDVPTGPFRCFVTISSAIGIVSLFSS